MVKKNNNEASLRASPWEHNLTELEVAQDKSESSLLWSPKAMLQCTGKETESLGGDPAVWPTRPSEAPAASKKSN